MQTGQTAFAASVIFFVVTLAGCTGNQQGSGDRDADGGGGRADTATFGELNTGTGETEPSRSSDSNEVCVSLDMSVDQLPVRLMILQDRSTSMNDIIGTASKWAQAEAAVDSMVTRFGAEIEFGLDFFPFGASRCDVPAAVISDTLPDNGDTVKSLMIQYTTPPSSLGTPLYLALDNYRSPEYAPLFSDVTHESYLVVISDGSDTCGVTGQDNHPDLEAELAAVTSELLRGQHIRTFAIGFGDASVYGDSGGLDVGQLNAIAENGGTPYQEYINAQDGAALENALGDIAEAVHVSCAFELDAYDPEAVNMDLVNIYFDKTVDPVTGEVVGAVGRDDGCESGIGWTFMDDARTTILFCEEACNMLQQQSVGEISIEIMCNAHQVVIV